MTHLRSAALFIAAFYSPDGRDGSLRFGKNQVQHPAPANVDALRVVAMCENFGALTPCLPGDMP